MTGETPPPPPPNQRKPSPTALAIFILAAGFAAGYCCGFVSRAWEVENLENQVRTLRHENSLLQDEIDSLESDKARIQSIADDLGAQVEDLRSRAASLQSAQLAGSARWSYALGAIRVEGYVWNFGNETSESVLVEAKFYAVVGRVMGTAEREIGEVEGRAGVWFEFSFPCEYGAVSDWNWSIRTSETPLEWKLVRTFGGRAGRTATDEFALRGDEVKVEWTWSGDGIFYVSLYSYAAQQYRFIEVPDKPAHGTGRARGVSFVMVTPGTCYFDVLASTPEWSVSVYEK